MITVGEFSKFWSSAHVESNQSTDTLRYRQSHMLQSLGRLACLCLTLLPGLQGISWAAQPMESNQDSLLTLVREFADAVAKGDRVTAGQRDFVCLQKMAQQHLLEGGAFPDALSPVYEWCEQRRHDAYQQVINQKDRALDNVWPGPGKVVDFADFQSFFISETQSRQLAPSFFVMPGIAEYEPDTPFIIDALESGPLPHASFPSADASTVLAAPTLSLTTRISYPNPLTAPISNGPGAKDWAVPYKKVQRVIKSVKVKWVVLHDLRSLGFPTDFAILDIPLNGPHGTTVPFVVDAGGFIPKSTEWFGEEDRPDIIPTGIQQAQAASTPLEGIMKLNRVLMIAPTNKQALEVFADQLYQGLMNYGTRLHTVNVGDKRLAQRFNELYWTIQSQTDRFDLALGMEIGGKSEPMPADYLYRMIPVMEALASLEPGNFHNRLRLSAAYRWTNDQMAALSSPQELLAEIPSEQGEIRVEALLELAWARIGKVAWNRHLDDPDIQKGFESAKRAYEKTQDPINKFTAAYAMAHSLAFHVPRDNQAMFEWLKQARDWFEQIPGSTSEAWAFMLENDTMKGLVETDNTFKALLAAR
jgi:hypothetical protein